MRIVLIGQAAFAEQVLDGLRENGHEIAAVYCPPDAPGGKVDPVKQRAVALGIPVSQHRSLKHPAVQQEIAQLNVELGVLAYVTQIVPVQVIDTPARGSICFHPSLLPAHRGGSAIPWQIILGKTRTGVTVFWADAGIDTGPILLQREATIDPEDTGGTLYYKKLFPLGVATVLESVELIAKDAAPRVTQDEKLATYEPLCRDEHAEIDWQRPVEDVHNLIRGCDPQPGAYMLRQGEKVRLYDAQIASSRELSPGVVGAIEDGGVVIGAAGGAIRVGRIRTGGKKMAANEAAAILGLAVGQPLAAR